jgi:hypothetical protein
MHARIFPPCSGAPTFSRGLIPSFLLLWLIGCAAPPVVESRPPPPPQQRERPPASLVVVTAPPGFAGRTNGDLLNHLDDWRAALNQCNANVVGVKAWADLLK